MELGEIVNLIRRSPAKPMMTTRIVAIDGCAGAGKSTFASALAGVLEAAPIIPTDDFASWEIPLDWTPRFIEQVLLPLSRNEDVRYQRYDWVSRRLAEWITVVRQPYLLVEGVGSSRLDFAPYLTFSIWIDTDRDERLRRGLQRDGVEMTELWLRWMAEEDAYVAREAPGARADLVLRGDG